MELRALRWLGMSVAGVCLSSGRVLTRGVCLSAACAAAMVALFVLPGSAGAAPYETTWLFRSPVTQGQSMWGPGIVTSYNFSDQYLVTTWPLNGTGFSWSVQAEQGIVSGDVEGLVKAKYDSVVSGSNTTTIHLSYGAMGGESRIGTNLAASLTATPRLRAEVLPWPFPAIDWSMPISAFNTAVSAKTDYSAVLGGTVAGTGSFKMLPFSVDLGLVNAHMDFSVKQDILFTPRSVTGSVRCTHMATGASRMVDALLTTDGADVAIDLPLDLKGHWEIDLEDFRVTDNLFHQDLGLGVELGVGIPLFGANWAFAEDTYFDLYRSDFSLAFDNHGSDGSALTHDNLGRFWIYADPAVPEPATLALLAAGLSSLYLRRRARS